MKKIFGVILFYCPFILISCKKNLSTNVESKSVTTSVASALSSSDQYLVDVFSYSGIAHNDGLDYVYFKLDSLTYSDPTFDTLSLVLMNQLSFGYLHDSLAMQGFNDTAFYSSDSSVRNQNLNIPIATNVEQITGVQLTNKFKNAMASLESILWNDSINTQYYKYDSLIYAVVPTLGNNQDKSAFIAAVSIGKMSTEYWYSNENVSKWDSLFSILEDRYYGSTQKQFSNRLATSKVSGAQKGVIYSDVKGAVRGAVLGAFYGGAGGTLAIPGIGTVAGAVGVGLAGMVGGAIFDSAESALDSLIQWAIGW